MHLKEIPLSIVITTYNRYNLLKRCINSIINQDYKNYEIIIIDDHSIPSYENEIIKEFPQIRYIYQDKNTGPGAARNKGISVAENNYIIIMDDDDIFANNAFKKINGFLFHNSHLNYPVYNFLCTTTPKSNDELYNVYSFSDYIAGSIVGDTTHVINKELFWNINRYQFPISRIGAEMLLWLQIARDFGYILVNEIIVQVTEDSSERLTDISRQVKNADLFAQYQIDVIAQFEMDILNSNGLPFLISKYIGAITYLLLEGKKKYAFYYWRKLCSLSKKSVVLFPLFILPRKIIILLFYKYRKYERAK